MSLDRDRGGIRVTAYGDVFKKALEEAAAEAAAAGKKAVEAAAKVAEANKATKAAWTAALTAKDAKQETTGAIQENYPVTSKAMEDFGWTAKYDINHINAVLKKYGITNMDSIRLFLATCGHESELGERTIERLNSDGTVAGHGYTPLDRGAGYIQLTHRDTHLKFLKSVNDSYTGQKTAEYIANNYPWEAAAWFWSSADAKSVGKDELSFNDYSAKYGDSKGVYLITQYYVSGTDFNCPQDIAEKIRNGTINWRVNNGRLFVDGKNICAAPSGWENVTTGRSDTYNSIVKVLR